MPKVTSEQQAKEILVSWIRSQGYQDEIRFSMSYGLRHSAKRGNYFDFDVVRPYGVFLVYEDGSVEDNYGYFKK